MKVAASRDDGTGCLSWPDRPASWANAGVTSHNKDKTLHIFGTVSPQAECCDQAVSFCSLLAVSREAIELYDHVRSAAQLRRPHRILAGAPEPDEGGHRGNCATSGEQPPNGLAIPVAGRLAHQTHTA